jgi:bifunctional non-homologous end joining protein LigD
VGDGPPLSPAFQTAICREPQFPALRIVRDLPGVKGAPMPSYIEPCLATLAERPPAGERWVHEIKFDGYRLQLHVTGGKIGCFTRRGA